MTRTYLDYNATAPLDPAAAEAMVRVAAEAAGNASSPHAEGRAARRALDEARARVAALVGARPEEVVFTGGGTEADNLAVLGAVRYLRASHVVISSIEHPAVIAAAERLEYDGVAVTRVRPDAHGVVDAGEVLDAIGPGTGLVSIMLANNETGVIQPVAEIAREARARGVLVHTDAVQAVGKIPVDVRALDVDLLSTSAHKLHGPGGIGALVVREGTWVEPLVIGGGQERGLRSGTSPVAQAVGFGVAAEVAREGLAAHAGARGVFTRRFEAGVHERIPSAVLHGAAVERLPGTTSMAVPGIAADALVAALDLEGFAVSAGAACATGAASPSHVLSAMGVDEGLIRSTIRVSAGRSTTEDAADALVEALVRITARIAETTR